MYLELSKKAFERVSEFKDHCTEYQFKVITEAIKEHDVNLSGSGFASIQAKIKLTYLATIELPIFIESLKSIN